jgi:hypothetical protein
MSRFLTIFCQAYLKLVVYESLAFILTFFRFDLKYNTTFLYKNKSVEDDDLDLESMVDDFLTFFLAGQETTANALAFCFLEIGRHPAVLEK